MQQFHVQKFILEQVRDGEKEIYWKIVYKNVIYDRKNQKQSKCPEERRKINIRIFNNRKMPMLVSYVCLNVLKDKLNKLKY